MVKTMMGFLHRNDIERQKLVTLSVTAKTGPLLLRLCVSLLPRFIIVIHYIILHNFRHPNGYYDYQILCLRAVLAIGIATNSSVCRVIIRSQYGTFTERALIILQLHKNRKGESTHKVAIKILLKQQSNM